MNAVSGTSLRADLFLSRLLPLCSLKLPMGSLAGELRVVTDRKRKKADEIAFALLSKSVVSAQFQHSTSHSSKIIQQSTRGATFGFGNGNKALAKTAVRCLLLAFKAKRKGWRKGHQTPRGRRNVPKGLEQWHERHSSGTSVSLINEDGTVLW